MRPALDRAWRGVGTALSFSVFGLGGVLIGLVIAPLIRLTVRDRERRQRLGRRLIQRSFAGFIALMKALGVIDYQIDHLERLRRPGLLVIANHPTLIDTIFLIAHVDDATCIVKGALARNPVTRGPIRLAGYISNASPEEVIDSAAASLRAGQSLVIFPEGTRTPPGGAIRLRRGGANIALRTNTAITPVVIDCQPPTLGKHEPWYRIPARRVRLRLSVSSDLPVICAPTLPSGLAARALTAQLNEHFNNELERLRYDAYA
ncbi:lysophospholipid acyltransferase family protein [Halotalea alkalilenta]|uniref:lysophospholipid acyltransferase family protein n=1 Tax=Halotalea alkalilenta TaxID=376489 RepID=UPI0004827149|nr:lysophospholipid acyltransferase family protein [Halotalea alkalilenta]